MKIISQLTEGEEQTIVANVWQAQETRPGGRRSTEAIVGDETGNIRVVWFNQPYLAKTLTTNARIMLSGRVSLFKGRHVFQSPEWELMEGQDFVHTARLVPVYPLTAGLASAAGQAADEGVHRPVGRTGEPIFCRRSYGNRLNLLELPAAISQAHYPEDEATKDKARIRLAFDELFLLQLGVMSKKRDWQESRPGTPFDIEKPLLKRFLKSLPFTLTAAQDKVLREILGDLEKATPMCRLLQGEVGSGKTVVATAALLMAAANGYQGAFMAPTEILAEQHFATIAACYQSWDRKKEEGYITELYRFIARPAESGVAYRRYQAGREKEDTEADAGQVISISLSARMPWCRRAWSSTNWDWWWSMSSTASAWNSARRCGKRGSTRTCW